MFEAPFRFALRRGRTLKRYLADSTPSGVVAAKRGVSSVRTAARQAPARPLRDAIATEQRGVSKVAVKPTQLVAVVSSAIGGAV